MPNCECSSCGKIFQNRSWNTKYCPECKSKLEEFESSIYGKSFNEFYFYNKNFEKFENENGGYFIILHYKIKGDYNEVDFYFKRCVNCKEYTIINISKGFHIIDNIKNGGITTCSYKCKNEYNYKIGVDMVCKYCKNIFKSHNPNIRICNDCKNIIDNLKDKMRNINCDKDFENLNIIYDFENENGGKIREIEETIILNEIEYKFNFYFKKCKICSEWVLLQDHIDRKIDNIKNGSPTFCSNQCNNKNLIEVRKDGFNLICKNCKKEFHSFYANEHYCQDCSNLLKNINKDFVNLNDDWFKDKNIIESFSTDKGAYKIINYKGLKVILKWCFTCNKWNITNERRTPTIVRNGGYTFCCEKHSKFGVPNFIYKDVLYYKNEPIYNIIQKLESGEYNLKDFPGWNKRWCENCNKYEYHYEKECLVCGEVNKLSNSNFTERNGVKYYKNIEINEFCNKIISDEFNCSDYSGINIRFGHVCYGTEDIITGEHYYLSGNNFKIVEGVEFILTITGQYEPSKEFYDSYNKRIKTTNPSDEVQNLIDNEGFTLEPIITTGTDSWSRSRTDKYLSDKGYGWIVYIKLLNGHPWIVGKTGTKLVSQSPIDFDFTITDQRNPKNPDYAGPGREYARRYYPEKIYSDFDSILCKNFPCKQDALIFEEFIAQEYDLFES